MKQLDCTLYTVLRTSIGSNTVANGGLQLLKSVACRWSADFVFPLQPFPPSIESWVQTIDRRVQNLLVHPLHEFRHRFFARSLAVLLPDLIQADHLLRRIDNGAHVNFAFRQPVYELTKFWTSLLKTALHHECALSCAGGHRWIAG